MSYLAAPTRWNPNNPTVLANLDKARMAPTIEEAVALICAWPGDVFAIWETNGLRGDAIADAREAVPTHVVAMLPYDDKGTLHAVELAEKHRDVTGFYTD